MSHKHESTTRTLLVALVIFMVLRFFRGTQALQLLRGILIVAVVIAALRLVVDE